MNEEQLKPVCVCQQVHYMSKWYQKAENWKVIITVIVTASLNEDEYFEYKVRKMNINFKDID